MVHAKAGNHAKKWTQAARLDVTCIEVARAIDLGENELPKRTVLGVDHQVAVIAAKPVRLEYLKCVLVRVLRGGSGRRRGSWQGFHRQSPVTITPTIRSPSGEINLLVARPYDACWPMIF